MYRGKHTKRAAHGKRRAAAWLVSIVVVLCVSIGGTLAFLADSSDSVTNTFQPSKVTTYVEEDTTTSPGVKQNVKIQNTGDIDAYIRAAVIVTWKNADGEIAATKPVAPADYTIAYNLTDDGWSKVGDYYYWNGKVIPNGYTDALITSCQPVSPSTAPAGYSLSVEIIGSGIQADGVNSNKEPAVQAAWGKAAADAVGAK